MPSLIYTGFNLPTTDVVKMYGKKGMHWGVRTQDGGKSMGKPTPKKASEMSDKELKARVNRMNLEKDFKRLTSEQKKANMSLADKVAQNIVDSVTKSATQTVNNYVQNKVSAILTKALDSAFTAATNRS